MILNRSLLQFGGGTFFRSQIQPHNTIEDEFNTGLFMNFGNPIII